MTDLGTDDGSSPKTWAEMLAGFFIMFVVAPFVCGYLQEKIDQKAQYGLDSGFLCRLQKGVVIMLGVCMLPLMLFPTWAAEIGNAGARLAFKPGQKKATPSVW